jgi:hypothetical protein
VWRLDKHFLDVGAHARRPQHLVAFVHHEVLAVLQLYGFVLHQIQQTARSRDDDVRGQRFVLQLLHVVRHVGAAVVAADTQLWLFEVLSKPLEVFVDLMG